jgi:hypothetical protein
MRFVRPHSQHTAAADGWRLLAHVKHETYRSPLTAHSTEHTAQSTQHTAHSTQHTAHSTQHTAHSTQHSTQRWMICVFSLVSNKKHRYPLTTRHIGRGASAWRRLFGRALSEHVLDLDGVARQTARNQTPRYKKQQKTTTRTTAAAGAATLMPTPCRSASPCRQG